MSNKIRVRLADWQKDNADLRRIREAVFIAEQSVPPELEWDAEDAEAVRSGECAATAEALLERGIERMLQLYGRACRP